MRRLPGFPVAGPRRDPTTYVLTFDSALRCPARSGPRVAEVRPLPAVEREDAPQGSPKLSDRRVSCRSQEALSSAAKILHAATPFADRLPGRRPISSHLEGKFPRFRAAGFGRHRIRSGRAPPVGPTGQFDPPRPLEDLRHSIGHFPPNSRDIRLRSDRLRNLSPNFSVSVDKDTESLYPSCRE